MAFIDNAIKEKISTRLETEIKNAIDAQKYRIRRNMRENLKKKTDDINVSPNSAPYKVLYEQAEKEIEFLIADIEEYRTLLEKEKAKKWYQKLWESIEKQG
ncbi:MAG: hypothetical protein SPJ69_00395 [Campylobacter sp.]|uniref:hypothetical protein n=1 Tax=Campylobacter sp. TaxID=205 RepID=UPI00297783D1|nr:hypothetical protein [Campylobacter sp.]MDD7600269.1 hypothetical protein [Campylobacteraceae bacterium]MDY5886762.1 hypothetical protein [Campylobacter sp.]